MNVEQNLKFMDYGPAPESRAEADEWLKGHNGSFGPFINGILEDTGSRKTYETKNPATGEILAQISLCDEKDVDAAVAAAAKAQPGWAGLSGHQRAKYLYALARLVQKHSRILAVLETLDNGKSIRESRDIDLPLVARHFYHHAGWAQLFEKEFNNQLPVGVVGQIIPWNFPLLMLAWKIAPALAAGNTVVLKPAEYTSLTALRFAELCIEAGLPAGVVNIVTGNGTTGELIVGHSDINKIAFTGSTEVGRRIREKTAGSGKKLSLELGGKSPFIVFDDADLDSAVEGVVDAIWLNQGQVCCAGSRLLVQENIEAVFIAKLKARMKNLRLGDPLDKCIDMGAIVDEVQRQAIDAMVQEGVAQGIELWQTENCPTEGCFYPPTLLTNVETSSSLMQNEIFGPVLVSTSFRTPSEAIELANNTRYGLAASIWSENINLALDIAPAVKAGVVWINCTNQLDAAVGFGGYRESGFGREGGVEGMQEYLVPAYEASANPLPTITQSTTAAIVTDTIDRTAKMYIGGKQARPDSGYSRDVYDAAGSQIGVVGDGNRKDIRNAVEAARKAEGWGKASAHNRAQILYYIAENLSARSDEFAHRISSMTGTALNQSEQEVEMSVSRLFSYGAWADKYDGSIHTPPLRGVALAMKEPVGIIGIRCPDEAPLLGLISTLAPAIAMGNRIIALPSGTHPLASTDFYQILDTSDLPGGVVNIITGNPSDLLAPLAEHDQVDAIWSFGSAEDSTLAERAAAHTLKRTWVNSGRHRNWKDTTQSEGREFLHHATEVKNIWIPYGE